MKKLINVDFRSMTGLGPKAWDRDDSKLSMHTVHPHQEGHHHSRRGNYGGNAATEQKDATTPHKAE